MPVFRLDWETYSEADLRKVGLDQYARHPSTEVLMGAWAYDQQPVTQSDEEPHFVKAVRQAAANPEVLFKAFNARFERIITKEVLGIDIPIERWRCTMVHAYHLSFTGGLGEVGKQLGLPEEKAKLTEGRRLIHKFSKPAPKNHLIDRYTKQNAPEDWQKFCEYNAQDVVAEREIDLLLSQYPMPESEWGLWFIDQRINDRGLPIDKELVNKALDVYQSEKKYLAGLLTELTGVGNPKSVSQLIAWFQAKGLDISSLSADIVASWLAQPPWNEQMTPEVRKAFELRQQLARSAGAKWEAFKRMTDWDTGRLRGVFQFGGASRTNRWAGRGLQPHNLHRSPEDQDEKVRSMLKGDRNWVEMLYS